LLWTTLLRWIQPLAQDGSPARQVARSGGNGDWEGIAGLNAENGLKMCGGNAHLYQKIITRFVESNSDLVARVHESMRNGDSADAERLAHTLKGVAGQIGAPSVQQLAAELEDSFRNGDPPAMVQDRLKRLERHDLSARIDSAVALSQG
jgi:two-component system sensor histidine kinase/response regulator